jgi:hypothetical protein
MLAWGMGSTTGHVTMALWIKGELFVLESQVKSSYWPTDNIQRTPFRQWLAQAHKAGYNVVHVPLRWVCVRVCEGLVCGCWLKAWCSHCSDAARASFDEKTALAYFESIEGIQYGYPNLLWGWVDTLKVGRSAHSTSHRNPPCLVMKAPSFSLTPGLSRTTTPAFRPTTPAAWTGSCLR